MSRTLWKALGILSLVAGLSLLIQAPDVFVTRPPDKQLEFIIGTAALIGLCIVIAVACWFPQSHPVTLRLIGAIGVAGCIFSIFDSFRHTEIGWLGIISRLGLIFCLWLPGSMYLVIKGKMTGF